MTGDSFAAGMSRMAAMWPRSAPAATTAAVYYDALADLSDDVWAAAVTQCLRDCTFYPVPAEIRHAIAGHYQVEDGLDAQQIADAVRGLATQIGQVERIIAILEQLQVPLGQVRDALGIPGMGEKTAAKWIREYGSLAGLVDHVEDVRGKVGDSLRANLSSVLTNRELTELVRDVDLPSGPDDLALAGWDREQIHKLFDDLEFRVLRDRLFSTLSSPEPEAESGFDLDGEVLAPGAVRAWLDAHARTGRSGVMVTGPYNLDNDRTYGNSSKYASS